MSISWREGHERLLADSRSAEPPTRLAQAVSRSEFLLRSSRTVSAIQNPQRALEALVTLLLEALVDVAEVVVRSGAWQLSAVGTQGGPLRSSVSRWIVDGSPSGVDDALGRGTVEEIVLPPAGVERQRVMASLFEDAESIAAIDALGVQQLIVLPMAARGRTFGILALGRAHGLGFGGAEPFLEDLAERVAAGLDAMLVVAESRHVATVLRRSLSPATLPEVPGLDLASFVRVAHESQDVGGDFIDLHGPADDVIAVCGDVAGKGVEAAVHAKRIRNAVRTAAHVDRGPSAILRLVNTVIHSEAEPFDERLATAACVRLRYGGLHLEADVASAGHPPALVLRADGTVDEVPATGPAIGLVPGAEYAETTLMLAPGDTLLLHTDGVTEARGAQEMFGDERLRLALRGMAGLPAHTIVDAIAIAVVDHLGDRAHDDIAILAVQHRPDLR